MKKILKSLLSKFNISIIKENELNRLYAETVPKDTWESDILFTMLFSERFGPDYLELIKMSKSQKRQDLFVISELGLKQGGYFVEFGATDGETLSNTWLLEKKFGFEGILAEPNPYQRNNIADIRDAHIEENCVWIKSGESLEFVDVGDLSTISDFAELDLHNTSRRGKEKFKVKTISLVDMLTKYGAPKIIDYLSIDTEGSEYEILNSHDFNQFKFKIITVEHNFSAQREKIHSLLTANGYSRKLEQLSGFDDWYVLSELLS